MSKHRHIHKQQVLREAEGYLELLFVSPQLRPQPGMRNLLASRALQALERVGDCGVWQAHSLYLRGQAYRMMERYHEAIDPLVAASRIDRNNIHIWLALAWCHKRCNRIDLAIEALEEAAEIDSQQAIIHYNLACYWSLARNVRRAVTCLSRAFELDANYRDRVAQEDDFEPIRHHPYFQALTTVNV